MSLKLPVQTTFITKEFQAIFNTTTYAPLTEFAALWDIPPEWNNYTILALGSNKYLSFVLSKLRHHQGMFIYATNSVFKGRRPRDVLRSLQKWASLREQQGLLSSIVAHAVFGGITSAIHLMSYKRVDPSVFVAPPSLPRVLAHIIDAAAPDAAKETPRTAPLDSIPCAPIVSDGVLRSEGLFDVFCPHLRIACPRMFKSMGWAHRPLSAREHLRAFNIPLNMDAVLLNESREQCLRTVLQRGITPLIASAVIRTIWSGMGGGAEVAGRGQPEQLTLRNKMERTYEELKWSEMTLDGLAATRSKFGVQDTSNSTHAEADNGLNPHIEEVLSELKEKHNIAKAVKADDARVPVELWDEAVCRGSPTNEQQSFLQIIREFML
jgi:hypothetical protein